jgi:hypothetical protein
MSKTTLCRTLLSLGLGVSALAQTFNGFTTGNIVVRRSVYSGSAATLAAGQPLPPVCPSTAACGTTPASASGAYPTTQPTVFIPIVARPPGRGTLVAPLKHPPSPVQLK